MKLVVKHYLNSKVFYNLLLLFFHIGKYLEINKNIERCNNVNKT